MSDWPTTRNAIDEAIVAASGLAIERVYWKNQDANQPGLDCIALSLGSEVTVGQDYIVSSTDLGRSPGTEIELAVGGVREVALQIEVFSSNTVASLAAPDALSRASVIKARLRLPGVRSVLGAVGVTPFDPGPIQYVPDVPQVNFRGRATIDVRCWIPAQAVAEYIGYIASLSGTATISGTRDGVPIELAYMIPTL